MILFPELAPEIAELRETLGIEEAWCNDINKAIDWD